MPPISAPLWVDGRPVFQTLAIQEDIDSVTIAVGPRRATWPAMFAAAGLAFLAGLEVVLLAAIMAADLPELNAASRVLLAVAASIAWLGIGALLLWQLRRQVNYRVVTIEEGIVTIASAPVWPWRTTMQLNVRDVINISRRPRRRWWPLPDGAAGPVVEYGIAVFHGGKGEGATDIIPPLTLSPQQAHRLNTLIDRYAFGRNERPLVGSRL